MLPASIQVCPVEIPGRGRREGEAAPESVSALAALLAKSLPLDVSPVRPILQLFPLHKLRASCLLACMHACLLLLIW